MLKIGCTCLRRRDQHAAGEQELDEVAAGHPQVCQHGPRARRARQAAAHRARVAVRQRLLRHRAGAARALRARPARGHDDAHPRGLAERPPHGAGALSDLLWQIALDSERICEWCVLMRPHECSCARHLWALRPALYQDTCPAYYGLPDTAPASLAHGGMVMDSVMLRRLSSALVGRSTSGTQKDLHGSRAEGAHEAEHGSGAGQRTETHALCRG